jgi:hypothetical protein
MWLVVAALVFESCELPPRVWGGAVSPVFCGNAQWKCSLTPCFWRCSYGSGMAKLKLIMGSWHTQLFDLVTSEWLLWRAEKSALDVAVLEFETLYLYDQTPYCVRSKVFAAVAILMMFFWVKSACGLVGRSQRFGEARCVHLQGWYWRRWLLVTSPHGDLTRKKTTTCYCYTGLLVTSCWLGRNLVF